MSDHRKRECVVRSGSCHVFLALRREKDNGGGYSGRSVFRQIIRDEVVDLRVIEAKCRALGGVWRVYRTVNRRCFSKAFRLFEHRLIDDRGEYLYRVDSLWMNCLLKSESRAEKFFMIDFDGSAEDFELFREKVIEDGVCIVDVVRSPGGFHIVTVPFKVDAVSGKDEGRSFKYRCMDVLKDGYVFVKLVEGF